MEVVPVSFLSNFVNACVRYKRLVLLVYFLTAAFERDAALAVFLFDCVWFELLVKLALSQGDVVCVSV